LVGGCQQRGVRRTSTDGRGAEQREGEWSRQGKTVEGRKSNERHWYVSVGGDFEGQKRVRQASNKEKVFEKRCRRDVMPTPLDRIDPTEIDGEGSDGGGASSRF